MEDAELDAIRQRRMAQLMQQQGGMPGGGQGQPQSAEEQQAQAEKQAAAEEQRRTMLHAVLMAEARERLARIALVKPDKARAVENMILAAAQRGQITERVSEERLVGMLEQLSERDTKPKVTIQRRRPAMFDDDD